MPVNPISARSVVHVPYTTPDVAQGHVQTFYLDCSCYVLSPGVIALDGILNPSTSSDWLISEVIDTLWVRANLTFAGKLSTVAIGNSWVYQNESDPLLETFIGFDLSDMTGTTGGTADGVGGSQLTINSQSTSRQNHRLIFTDMGKNAPFKQTTLTVPTLDDGSIMWFMYNSNVPFCTQDGEQLHRLVSVSTNYNEKLLRKYGFEYNAAHFV